MLYRREILRQWSLLLTYPIYAYLNRSFERGAPKPPSLTVADVTSGVPTGRRLAHMA